MLIGYSSNKGRYGDLTNPLVKKTGASALVLDYGGHGESPFDLDELTPAQNLLEVLVTFDWIVAKYPDARISVVSCSYGGYLSAYLARYRNFNTLVMRVPAIYNETEMYSKWCDYDTELGRQYRKGVQHFVDHEVLTSKRVFTGPAFVLTHEKDDVCPKSTTDAFIKSFDAESWEAKGFEHSFTGSEASSEAMEEYTDKIAEWLKK